MRGGEKVLREICTLFPSADLFTHVYDPSGTDGQFAAHRVKCSFIAHLPGAVKHYTRYVPFMPLAARLLNLDEYSLIISSESGPIKGIRKPRGTVHVCYCHTPMRYVWDMYEDYYSWAALPVRLCMPPLRNYLKWCDMKSAEAVDHFIANSKFVSDRIMRAYGRESVVIHPPVETEFFKANSFVQKEGFYLFCGHLTHYKRADIAVKAFNKNGKKLVIVGTGEELPKLRRMARANITFMGAVGKKLLGRLYGEAEALIFPGTEDFGIVPVEAQAAGTPVIAFKAGGALETVVDGKTGMFFSEQTEIGLCNAVEEFESRKKFFDRAVMVNHAEQFSILRFRREFLKFIEKITKDNLI